MINVWSYPGVTCSGWIQCAWFHRNKVSKEHGFQGTGQITHVFAITNQHFAQSLQKHKKIFKIWLKVMQGACMHVNGFIMHSQKIMLVWDAFMKNFNKITLKVTHKNHELVGKEVKDLETILLLGIVLGFLEGQLFYSIVDPPVDEYTVL